MKSGSNISNSHSDLHRNRQVDDGVAALLFLLVGAACVVWFLLGEKKRIELEFILWQVNHGACILTFSSIAAFLLAIVLLVRKRARLVTSEIQKTVDTFKEQLSFKTRVMVYAPQIGLSLLAIGFHLYYYYFNGVTRWCFFDFLVSPKLATVRGILVLLTAFMPAILLPFYVIVLLNIFGIAKLWRALILVRYRKGLSNAQLPYFGEYRVGKWPVFLLGARESHWSLKFEPEAKIPSWIRLFYPVIFGGLIIFGKKGSGKTSLLLRIIEDALRFPADALRLSSRYLNVKPAICVIEQKGDIADFTVKKAEELGRKDDVIRLGVGTSAKWNPLASLSEESRALDCRQIGFFLRCAMTAGEESSKHSFWHDNADNLFFRSSHLLALSGETVSFDTIYQLITSINSDGSYRDNLFSRAADNLDVRESLGKNVSDAREELQDTERYFEEEFVNLDSKLKTTIINTVSVFLQKFLVSEYKRSFCCSAKEPGHFSGFRDLIAQGKIFILDVRSNEHGTIANPLGVLVKLFYQAAVKTRDKYPSDTMSRATIFVMDEAQALITPSSSNTEGDDKYLEMSRSFNAIDVYATQQYSSIEASVGDKMARRIIGSFNNIICYKHNDPALTEYLQKLLGTKEHEERSLNVSESSSSAKTDVLNTDGTTETDHHLSRSISVQKRDKHLIDAAMFKEFSTFEAIGLFDFPDHLQVSRFFTKPHFVDPTTPHAKVLRLIREQK